MLWLSFVSLFVLYTFVIMLDGKWKRQLLIFWLSLKVQLVDKSLVHFGTQYSLVDMKATVHTPLPVKRKSIFRLLLSHENRSPIYALSIMIIDVSAPIPAWGIDCSHWCFYDCSQPFFERSLINLIILCDYIIICWLFYH